MSIPEQLGRFSKGNENSYSANFSESGGENCSDRCRLKKRTTDDNGMCYAVKIEKIYPNVKAANVAKRKLSPTQICNKIRLQIRSLRNFWLRFSALGSLPMIAKAKRTHGFESAFKSLIVEAEQAGAKIHLPIEETKKAAYYQDLISEVSGKTVVRESCQSKHRLMRAKNHRSFVVGDKGTPMSQRIDESRKLAADLRAKGESAVVCPAIKPRNHTGRKAKCGDCTACSQSDVKVVIYPLH